jgi:hypothetical protein
VLTGSLLDAKLTEVLGRALLVFCGVGCKPYLYSSHVVRCLAVGRLLMFTRVVRSFVRTYQQARSGPIIYFRRSWGQTQSLGLLFF